MLGAIQIYNNPVINFKSESFITLAIISWTYLCHSYYKKINIDYQYYKIINGRKSYDRTKHVAIKHWELERCLNESSCPFDNATKMNLRFLIGIRHEIAHQMTNSIDDAISSKLQACVFNYNYYLKTLFGNKNSIDKELSLAISIGGVDPTSLKKNVKGLNENLTKFISEFEENLSDDVFNA